MRQPMFIINVVAHHNIVHDAIRCSFNGSNKKKLMLSIIIIDRYSIDFGHDIEL